MAHVASDLKSHLLNRMLPQAGKQSTAADRQGAAPFDSILDETARPAPEPRSQRAADDNSPRADRSERRERPKPVDRPERAAKSDDSQAPADIAATPESAKDAVSESNPGEAVAAGQTASEGETKTGETAEQIGETKPADAAASEPVAVVIDPAIAAATAQANAETGTKAAAAVAAVAAAKTAEAAPHTAAEAGADAALADAMPDALTALAAKAEKKAEDKPALAAKADAKSEGKTDGKAQTALPADAAVQAAGAAEPHKDSGAHASAEETANHHRGVATDAPAAATADKTATVAPKTADLAPPPTLMAAQAPAHHAQTQGVAALAPSVRADTTTPAVPVAGVAFEITSKVMAGKNQFDIRLDPAELGRIHVRLDVDRDGNVVTHMTADRPDTLDMLRRDTAGLERALQDAGLKTSDNSLQFSLRDQSANQQQQQNNSGSNTANVVVEDEQSTRNEPAVRNYAAYRGQTGGLDIRV